MLCFTQTKLGDDNAISLNACSIRDAAKDSLIDSDRDKYQLRIASHQLTIICTAIALYTIYSSLSFASGISGTSFSSKNLGLKLHDIVV